MLSNGGGSHQAGTGLDVGEWTDTERRGEYSGKSGAPRQIHSYAEGEQGK